VVEWVAAQDWCNGNVGMWGLSYGGITSFKTAAEKPPHLKAIVPMMGSLDMYHDWVYPGGCRSCLSAVGVWGSWMLAMQLVPPMYQDQEGRWYEVWKERLDRSEPYVLPWQDHPGRDEFWQTKAVDAGQIETPMFLIGGWRDILPHPMVQAFEGAGGPRKLLMGPWLHTPPDMSPFTAIEHLPEMKRWWDHWLLDEPNGVTDEPAVTYFVQGGAQSWQTAQEWPPSSAEERTFYLSDGGCLSTESAEHGRSIRYQADPTVGYTAGLWDPFGLGIGLPLDQGPDDLRSLTFTTEPLDEDLVIAGAPVATLCAALEDGDDVNLVVKLCDISPDGRSSLITTGWLKGSHRGSHEQPEHVSKGQVYDFNVQLWSTSYQVPKGHRLRVSISCSDFPRIWPTRTNPTIRLLVGGIRASLIRFPVLRDLGPSPKVEAAKPGLNRAPLALDFEPRWKIEHDEANGAVKVSSGQRLAVMTPNRDGNIEIDHTAWASVAASHPDAAKVEGRTRITCETRGGDTVVIEADSWITQMGLNLMGKVSVNGHPFFEKQWRK
jgi:putative CocE/NonD family hydrolase